MKKVLITGLAVLLVATQGVATTPSPPVVAPTVFDTPARQAILIDASSGQLLFEKDADTAIPPASMSKIMTMYLVFEALRDGRLNREQLVTISSLARAQEGSRMFIEVGEKVKVDDLIHGAIIQSGNDACVALAEATGGSVEHFVALMNQKAAQLGLKNSHFANPTGLPNPGHSMSARDLATLASRLINDFPQDYAIYSQREFTWNGIVQPNRNPLLGSYPDADGVKTGHTDEAGYCLIGSALRDNLRLITVVTGLPSSATRGQAAAAILTMGFREFIALPIAAGNTPLLQVPVVLGAKPMVEVQLPRAMQPLLARQKVNPSNVVLEVSYNAHLTAPIAQGQEVAKLQLKTTQGDVIQEMPLQATQAVAAGGFMARWSWLWHSWFGGTSKPHLITAKAA